MTNICNQKIQTLAEGKICSCLVIANQTNKGPVYKLLLRIIFDQSWDFEKIVMNVSGIYLTSFVEGSGCQIDEHGIWETIDCDLIKLLYQLVVLDGNWENRFEYF